VNDPRRAGDSRSAFRYTTGRRRCAAARCESRLCSCMTRLHLLLVFKLIGLVPGQAQAGAGRGMTDSSSRFRSFSQCLRDPGSLRQARHGDAARPFATHTKHDQLWRHDRFGSASASSWPTTARLGGRWCGTATDLPRWAGASSSGASPRHSDLAPGRRSDSSGEDMEDRRRAVCPGSGVPTHRLRSTAEERRHAEENRSKWGRHAVHGHNGRRCRPVGETFAKMGVAFGVSR